MRRMMLLLLSLLIVAGCSSSAMNKRVDEEGNVHYGDCPLPDCKSEKMETVLGPSEEEIQRSRERTEPLIQEQKHREEVQPRRELPQKVLGTVVIGFAPTVLAVLPEPPIKLTFLIQPVGGGSTIRHRITDPSPAWVVTDNGKGKFASSHQNFSLSLPPGRYQISTIEIFSKSLSEKSFSLPVGEPTFTVPESNCVYVGRITYAYARLPPGTLAQARAAVGIMAKKRGEAILFAYLQKGTLVGASTAVDEPKQAERLRGRKVLAQARKNNCIVKHAVFQST